MYVEILGRDIPESNPGKNSRNEVEIARARRRWWIMSNGETSAGCSARLWACGRVAAAAPPRPPPSRVS